MKRYFFLSITCFALIIASCSSDDDDDISTTKNYLKVKGVEYDLNNIGTLYVWIYRSGLYETTLFLHSGPSGMNGEFVGEGDVIMFDIKSSFRDGLDSGYYTIDLEAFEGPQYIIDGGSFCYDEENHIDGNGNLIQDITISRGKLEVTRSGNIYSIFINCTGLNDEKITGFFKGPLYIINHLDWNN